MSFEVTNASVQQAAAGRAKQRGLQPQCLFELRNMRESRNFRPIHNDTDAENDSESNQQCVTRWPAVMLVFIDIRHDVDPRQNQEFETGALRRSRRAACTKRL
jgi:hypothetical protein